MDIKKAKEKALNLLPQVTSLNPESTEIIGAKLESLNAFEKRFGLSLPSELQDWLLICNGAVRVDPGGLFGVGHVNNTTIDNFFEFWPNWLTNGYLCLAGDGSGDYYVLASKEPNSVQKTCPIYFMDQEDPETPAYVVSSSLWYFLWFLWDNEIRRYQKRKTYWPFDKDFVLKYDPGILQIKSVSLPWEKQT